MKVSFFQGRHHGLALNIFSQILDTSFDQLCSSWEDMILELDSKFTNYARDCLSRNKEWSLCAELLEFILFGHCPSTLRKFLVEDWTAHSLKRTGTATLKTYESIKIICFQQLQFILQRMLLHASELLGNLRDTQRFAPFGITEHKAVQLCAAVGSILQKTQELHLIIEKSIIHLRAFFKWIYVAILGLSGRILPDDFPRVTPPERELVIEFITKYLKPVIIQGELQSFHIDLVQQYIRSGEVQRPLEAVADQSLPENEDRSRLRVLVNFSDEQLSSGNFPAGLFPYCPKATLADLVKTLSDRVQSLFGPPGPGDFSRSCFAINKLVSQVLVRTNAASTNILTAVHCQPTLIESNTNLHLKTLDTCPEKKTLLAWSCSMRESESKLMIAELTSRQPYTDLSITRTVCVAIDTLPSVSDHNNGSFELLGLEFFTSGSLLLLVSRPSRSTDPSISSGSFKDNNPSWFVMLQIQEVLSASNHAFYNCDSSFPDPLYSFIDESLRIVCPARLSNCITPDHVEPLPQNAIRFTSNGERSIVFVTE
ncbi:unnamed protein product [Dicrocoelium dendriticum]|nr:unnamed protein product [Dicrocoelium dendriticum]